MMIVWVIAFLVCFAILAWLVETAPEFEEMNSGEWRMVESEEKTNKNLFKRLVPSNQLFGPSVRFFNVEKEMSFTSFLKSIF